MGWQKFQAVQPATRPALLTAGDIELELQRLVHRLIAGAHLLCHARRPETAAAQTAGKSCST